MQFGFGSGALFAIRNDITNQTPVRFGAMQDVEISFAGDVKMLYSQSQYPIDSARGKVKIEGKAKVAQISAALFNTLYWGGTIAAGQTLINYTEAQTVPASTPFSIAATNAATFLDDLGVNYQTQTQGNNTGNLVFAPGATGGSGLGTYGLTAAGSGTYTFNTADKSTAVYLNYSYTTTTGLTVTGGNPAMGTTPRFKAEFTDTFEGGQVTLILYSCVGTTLTPLPTRIDDYYIADFAFTAFADASNRTFLFTTT